MIVCITLCHSCGRSVVQCHLKHINTYDHLYPSTFLLMLGCWGSWSQWVESPECGNNQPDSVYKLGKLMNIYNASGQFGAVNSRVVTSAVHCVCRAGFDR